MSELDISIEFEGGLEHDFKAPNGLKEKVPAGMKLEELPALLSKKYLDPSKPTRFLAENGHLLPGILVMINDADSEIDGMDQKLSSGDHITFISTLHGG
ncbi:hypothetical protein TVAG_319610 [Trichomonas vaginalis G3]|uniref:Ubiquitin-related modifier 1 homolog n=1 Tax=Trichomonas vaginalis (strain ATCC PRA-98 / G3) TaxID=412133 RepID=A2DQA9_TRIV3|nr:ubiquitin-related modifier 1 (Urm1) ubiquitin-like (Ubl) domain-containing protein [Trichomonas vaginalis G3]EAY17366.1 hypothetical protein TVAG_319610 [Trichomonas vaginalis G3]KAI5491374.1 ubiquitin-related modifier 1 (Urm1) ubiquitin-like (Ubl) domain-containing protein [Trichomonas vaginalis G3]|eukprot:XP_001330735.1 hypothetical protein [Trichomonas vaginalis G3]